jgi:hypothetical protein
MREIRTSGSEGGGTTRSPYPYCGAAKPQIRETVAAKSDSISMTILFMSFRVSFIFVRPISRHRSSFEHSPRTPIDALRS